MASASAVQLLRALGAGELSCAEATGASLEAIAAADDELRAFEYVAGEAALERARELDERVQAGSPAYPLRGVPIAIKDVFDTADMPTGYGSPLYRDHRPCADAVVVELLRAAGAVIVGKTQTAEFACMHPCQTRNPIDPRRTPGGSSSGSAAAVAAGMVPVATGTQTAASIIRPASYCGVLGYKPTYGAISTAGVLSTSHALDTVGLFATSVADLVLFARVCTTPLAGAPTWRSGRPLSLARADEEPPAPPRLAWARSPWEALEADARSAIEALVTRIEGYGARVEEIEAPGFDALSQAQQFIQRRETAAALRADVRRDPDAVSEELRAYVEVAAEVTDGEYEAALRRADEWRWRWADLLRGHDALLVPSTIGVPDLGLDFTGDPLPCRPWTLLGFPSLALPLAWTDAGLPIGVQLVGPLDTDARVLRTGAWLLAAER